MILIKNGRIVNPTQHMDEVGDILIVGNRIVKIGGTIQEQNCSIYGTDSVQVVEATGMVVAPGLVDVHVHFRDPGFTYKEDIITGAAAAAKGGFTTVVLMANTKPCVDHVETVSYILEKGKSTGIHVKTCANVTMGMQGIELVNMKELAEAGAVGFTDDGVPIIDRQVVKEAMEQAKALGKPLSFHEENPLFIENNGINSGKASNYYQVGGSEREAEIDMVRRDLELTLEIGADILIQHISTKEAVELVRQAKKQSSHIYAEATPHHFSLTEEALIEFGTLAKMNPPLREEADRLAIMEGLKDGTIDLIATDHAPHSKEEKAGDITKAFSGMIGLETSLSLGIQELVSKGYLTMSELIERMSVNPAKLYNLEAGVLAEGKMADLVIFHPSEKWVVRDFVSKSDNSPFVGVTLQGVVHYTICEGNIVYQCNHS